VRATMDGCRGRLDVRLRVLDLPALVACADDETRDAVVAGWGRCLDPSPSGPPELEVEATLDDLRPLHARLTAASIDAVGSRLLLRGAGVAAEDGRVVALLGGTPKRRKLATLALARGAFGYVTDEVVAIEGDRAVLPFPRPLPLDEPDLPAEDRGLRGPDDLGLNAAPEPLELAAIVLLDPQGDRSEPARLERLQPGEAVVALTRHVHHPGHEGHPLRRLAAVIERSGGVHRLSYDALEELPATLHGLLATRATTGGAPSWAPAGEPPADLDAVTWGLRDGRVRQVPFVDAIRIADELLVVAGRQPVRLSALGATIWEAARSAPRIPDLVAHVVEVHGPHPEAEALVRESVAAMVNSSVLGYGIPERLDHLLVSAAGPR
jgi:hypothetical protein